MNGERALFVVPAVLAAAGAGALAALDVALPLVVGGGALVGAGAAWLLGARASARTHELASAVAKLESGLAEHVEIAKLVADSNPDAIVFFSDDGMIRYANVAARELFFDGQSPEGQNFLRLLAQAPDALREALSGENERLFTVDLGGQRETYHCSRCQVTMLGDAHTMLVVKLLTREVSRREVDTLKTVVRVVSHEVNNSLAPITSLVSSARLMLDKPVHLPKLSSALDTIEERARHLQGFLEGYAGLARLPLPRPMEVELGPLLEHLRALYPAVKLPDAPETRGFFDAAQIEQVLINLVKNAVEAGSPPSDVELRVALEAEGTTRFEVADRGRGLSREALESALVPLYTTKEKGSGIGLTICREIVDAHGGSLSLANRDGGGAVATLVLPGKKKPDAHTLRSRAKLTLSRT